MTEIAARKNAIVITNEPIIEVIAEMKLDVGGVMRMAEWVKTYRPKCVPEGGFNSPLDLVPHDGKRDDGSGNSITDNELLVELAGRKCYDSFAEQGAKRSNADYIKNMWTGKVPHRSTGYHAKMSFFFAHISRRVSHELIRNYVGADRDEEGSPSQESTRFTHHPGVYIAHPRLLDRGSIADIEVEGSESNLDKFQRLCDVNYADYIGYLSDEVETFRIRTGAEPKGMDKKRIYEAAAGLLLMSCGTSFIWTTNPMALTKFFYERDDEAADMEMQRFAKCLKKICLSRWPNLFPGVV